MKTKNIISAYQSVLAIENAKIDTANIDKILDLSSHEARTLAQFCNMLMQHNISFDIFDGYYISYSIKQISKEFDLLRFSDELVINIELKSELELDVLKKMKKINSQMDQNHYYLTSIGKNVLIYTYVENDGLYKYNTTTRNAFKIEFSELIAHLSAQIVNYNFDPDKLFVPSNYLISPFNSTQRFINDEYFFNGTQQNIKKVILKSINNSKQEFFCISANAGTGKTLLVYDIAKSLINENKRPLIIHCGKLNDGHDILMSELKWNIVSIASISNTSVLFHITETTDVIVIDESQRIRDHQLNYIIGRVKTLKIPIIFAYDKKQYLKDGETKDIFEYLKEKYSSITTVKKTLTNKIRTNEEMASFITNLFDIGKSNSHLNYENVTIEYFDSFENSKSYMEYLRKNRGWKAITYTGSVHYIESISEVASICYVKAHHVIGQEFDKVVFVMDQNFRYSESGKLQVSSTFYSVSGMLYQIVTRVINELKIIVLNNPELYGKLLEIKLLDKKTAGNLNTEKSDIVDDCNG